MFQLICHEGPTTQRFYTLLSGLQRRSERRREPPESQCRSQKPYIYILKLDSMQPRYSSFAESSAVKIETSARRTMPSRTESPRDIVGNSGLYHRKKMCQSQDPIGYGLEVLWFSLDGLIDCST